MVTNAIDEAEGVGDGGSSGYAICDGGVVDGGVLVVMVREVLFIMMLVSIMLLVVAMG